MLFGCKVESNNEGTFIITHLGKPPKSSHQSNNLSDHVAVVAGQLITIQKIISAAGKEKVTTVQIKNFSGFFQRIIPYFRDFLASLPKLERVEFIFTSCRISEEFFYGFHQLLRSHRRKWVPILKLEECDFSDGATKNLADLLKGNHLHEFYFSLYKTFSREDLLKIIQALALNINVTKLHLDFLGQLGKGTEGTLIRAALAKTLPNFHRLREVILYGICENDQESASILGGLDLSITLREQKGHPTILRRLVFVGNCARNATSEPLARLLRRVKDSLVELNLEDNEFGGQSLKCIAPSMSGLSQLLVLNLSHNRLNFEATRCLKEISIPTLKICDLSRNHSISEASIDHLTSFFNKHEDLVTFRLGGCEESLHRVIDFIENGCKSRAALKAKIRKEVDEFFDRLWNGHYPKSLPGIVRGYLKDDVRVEQKSVELSCCVVL